MLVTADGWVKRQKEINPETTRLREGDRILSLVAGSTRATITFFSNYGTAYTCRIIDIPATTGYGEPIQKLFKLKDGERIVAAVSMDDRVLPPKMTAVNEKKPDDAPKLHGLAVTSDGYSLRFGLDNFREVSTKAGRRYARPSGGRGGDAGRRRSTAARRSSPPARTAACCCARPTRSTSSSGAGKGVLLIKLEKGDRLLAAITAVGRPRHAHREDQHGRRAAAEHRPLQGDRPRRQGPRVRQPRADRRSDLRAGRRTGAAGRELVAAERGS